MHQGRNTAPQLPFRLFPAEMCLLSRLQACLTLCDLMDCSHQATVHEVAESDPTERRSTEQHADLFYNISFQIGRTAEILRWAK